MIYDLEKEEIIHEEPEWSDISSIVLELIAITDDLSVIMLESFSDRFIIYDTKTKERNEYYLSKLADNPDASFIFRMHTSSDGKKLLFDTRTGTGLFLFNVETEETTELLPVEAFANKYNTDFAHEEVRFSPDGTFIYAKITEVGNDPVYESHNFINTETGEVRSFVDFDYYFVSNIDENGNMALASGDELFLYSIPNDQVIRIPFKKHLNLLALSGNGQYLFIDDSEPKDENRVYSMKKLSLEQAENFEVAEMKASLADMENSLSEETKAAPSDELNLQEINIDIRQKLTDAWNAAENLYFATSYPKQPKYIDYTVSESNVYQTLVFEEFGREEIEIKVMRDEDFASEDMCVDDDLDLIETIDGINYYFKSFSSSENELSFVIDGQCVRINGEDVYSEDQYLSLATSFANGKPLPVAIDFGSLKFPTVSPIGGWDLETFLIIYEEEFGFRYVVDFGKPYDTADGQLAVQFFTANAEPVFYNDTAEQVEVAGYEQAFFNEETLELDLFDGNHYYTYAAKMNTETRNNLGIENIKNMLIQMAEMAE